jgi:2-amino-4-hydroxy-6-hydroxymethyldihydropteridine diphosphokinase
VGFEGDNFLNLVAGLDTDQEVHDVNRQLHAIEDAHGRQRNGPRFSPRTLDLDLLLYDDLILSEDKLQLPRDEITHNAFVLRPLADIAPDLRHPVTGQTMAELWQAFDQTSQRLWPIPFEW